MKIDLSRLWHKEYDKTKNKKISIWIFLLKYSNVSCDI